MKQLLSILFVSCLSLGVEAQTVTAITIGTIDSIHSEILQEQRKIWVYVPTDTTQSYPVLYLLDGDVHFYSVVGMLHQLSVANGNTVCPKMIVVGILNTNRTRDLTPTPAKISQPYVDSALVANTGGGENFLAFIEKELAPYIERNYSTTPYRLLVGHSFGGLLTVHALFNHRNFFNSYLAIDPPMHWDDYQLWRQISDTSIDESFTGNTLFLATANTMEDSMDTLSVQNDTSFATAQIRSNLVLNRHLSRQAEPHLKYRWKFYPDDDHTSVPLIATYDALRFIFEHYQFKISYRDYINPPPDFYERVLQHYQRLSDEFGYAVLPPENFVNNLGYAFLNSSHFDLAEQFFQLNTLNYPNSSNAFDSLGDFYRSTGKVEEAITNYEKAVQLNPHSVSQQKLDALKR